MAANWGLAALVYSLVGGLIARLLLRPLEVVQAFLDLAEVVLGPLADEEQRRS